MQFAVIFAVVMALSTSGEVPADAVALSQITLVLAAMAAVVLFARVTTVATVIAMGGAADRPSLLRSFERLRAVHLLLWLVTVAFIVFHVKWPLLVRTTWQLDGSFLLDEALLLAPVFIPLIVSWAVFFNVFRELQERVDPPQAYLSRRGYVAFHIRHYLGLVAGPLILILAAADAIRWLSPDFLGAGRMDAFLLATLFLMAAMLPVWLRFAWATDPLDDGHLRDQLKRVESYFSVTVREILVWQSGRLITNAAVAGLFPRLRYVFLSDGLLARLDEDQVTAAYSHELAHIVHRHLLLRVAALILPGLIAALLFGWDGASGSQFDAVSILFVIANPWFIAAMAMLYVVTVFARYCRMMEHQADLTAARSLMSTRRDVTDTIASYAGMLVRLQGNQKNSGIFHPDVPRRIEFLRATLATNRTAARFERNMKRRARLISVISLLCLLGLCAKFAGIHLWP